MKLAFSTLGCPEWSLKYAIDRAKALGFQGIEIRGIKDCLRADTIEELQPVNRDGSLSYAGASGVELCCLGASASFHEKEKREENIEEALSAVRLAELCGIPYVRVFGNNLVTDNEAAEIEEIGTAVRELCGRAQDFNVEILLEVHGDFNTSARILKLAAAVNSENFGIVWDIQHSREDIVGFWNNTKHLVRHIHIKDSVGGKLCSTGEGELPIAEIVKMVTDDNYNGYFSLEWEKRWHPDLRQPDDEFPAYVKFMNEIFRSTEEA